MKLLIYSYLFILFLIACKNDPAHEMNLENRGIILSKSIFKENDMLMGHPTMQEMEQIVQVTGHTTVPSQNSATLSSYLSGYLKNIPCKIGDEVKPGQALLVIESHELLDLQKEFVQVSKQMFFLKSEFERQKKLYEEHIISQKNYNKSKSDYESYRGVYENIRQRLLLYGLNPNTVEQGKFSSLLTIKSPIAGYISKINTNPGAFVETSEHLIEVVNPKYIQLELKVFQKDLLKIKVGQIIKFSTQNSSVWFESKISHLNKVISPTDNSVSVYGQIDSDLHDRLAVGMFVKGHIVIGSEKLRVVPSTAVLEEDNKYYVFVLKSELNDGFLLEKKMIKIGQKNEDFIELLPESGLDSSNKILFKGLFYL